MEIVIGGSFHKASGRTPFEAFNAIMQVHNQLILKRQKEMRDRNGGRRDIVRGDLHEGNRVLVYEFENANRGRLGKLVAR